MKMFDKKEAIDTLLNKYTDVYGRTTLYLAEKSDPKNGKYDSGNPHLFTGIATYLVFATTNDGVLCCRQAKNFHRSIKSTIVQKGLFSRHPDPYRFTEAHDPISLDEYYGLCYSTAIIPRALYIGYNLANDIVEYGQKNSWVFDDKNPGKVKLSLNIFSTLSTLFKVIVTAFKTKKYGGSKEIDKIIDSDVNLRYLSRIRLPKDRFLPKALSSLTKPSLLEKLFIFFGIFSTMRKSNTRVDGKIMDFFQFLVLKHINYDSFLVNRAAKLFNSKMIEQYGENYPEVIFKIYFKDENHPFHTLIKGIKL